MNSSATNHENNCYFAPLPASTKTFFFFFQKIFWNLNPCLNFVIFIVEFKAVLGWHRNKFQSTVFLFLYILLMT